ncbi:MAG TPA: glycoside hydrolase family 20 zincin-like fold domain-containing protein, partial [Rhodothermales bacterium]|nr:glycoside hydrolase family 20 zincin-like fold domain-containing protein [Rhodothermales bacterium]
MRRYFSLALALLLLVATSALAQNVLPVIPAPKEVRFDRGAFFVGTSGPEIRVSARDTAGLGLPVGQLRAAFDAARPAQSGRVAGRRVWLGLPDQDAAFAAAWRRVGTWPEARLGEEGYALHVSDSEILVAANTTRGLFYGAQTLVQMLRAYDRDARLPAVHVVDWPDLKIRGLMDDISRGPIPTPEMLRAQIRRAAE